MINQALHNVYMNITNEMYEQLEKDNCFDIRDIERIILKELLPVFNQQKISRMMGVDPRTVRKKTKENKLERLKIVQSNKNWVV